MKPTALKDAAINQDGSVDITLTIAGDTPLEVAFLGFCAAIITTQPVFSAALASIHTMAARLKIVLPDAAIEAAAASLKAHTEPLATAVKNQS